MNITSLLRSYFYSYYYPQLKKVNISFKKRYIFIHIPKNAGTSISKYLGFEKTYHTKIIQLQNILTQRAYNSFFKFAFSRNPYDRFLSLYYYAIAPDSYYHSATNPKNAINGLHPNYLQLKNKSVFECAELLITEQLRIPDKYYIWAPQSEWILDHDNKIGLDFIGRYENLDEDLKAVLSRLDIEYSALSKYNNSSNKKTINTLDNKTKEIIYEYYKDDFILLGYKK